MIIDFHTHVFPDKIAASTIDKLEKLANVKAFCNGTLNGLKKKMEENNIQYSVVLPVITGIHQFETITQYAVHITKTHGIISFGGIHPDSRNWKEEIKQLKSLGLKGIKLHPDYQKTFIDDSKYIKIIDMAACEDFIIVIHAGKDTGFPEPVHCTPEKAYAMYKQVQGAKVVLAHMGGAEYWDQVEEYIVGTDMMIDTSYSIGELEPTNERINMRDEQFLRIVKNHGADKILFGTDSPWGNQVNEIEYIKNIGLSKKQQELIFYKNALQLLKIKDI